MIAFAAVAERPGHSLSERVPMESERPSPAELKGDDDTRKIVREILELLPQDIVEELNKGQIDPGDPAFLDGLTDHVARHSLADPRNGQRILGKMVRLKKQIRRSLRESDPEVVTSATVTRRDGRVGRNEPCPCGSGRKFKQCCMRKA